MQASKEGPCWNTFHRTIHKRGRCWFPWFILNARFSNWGGCDNIVECILGKEECMRRILCKDPCVCDSWKRRGIVSTSQDTINNPCSDQEKVDFNLADCKSSPSFSLLMRRGRGKAGVSDKASKESKQWVKRNRLDESTKDKCVG